MNLCNLCKLQKLPHVLINEIILIYIIGAKIFYILKSIYKICIINIK